MTDTGTPLVPERLHDLAPSRKLVYLAIHREPPTTTRAIAATTGLSPSTVRKSVADLQACGEIEVRPTTGDARGRQFRPPPTPDPPPR